jgi:hypothetical protein
MVPSLDVGVVLNIHRLNWIPRDPWPDRYIGDSIVTRHVLDIAQTLLKNAPETTSLGRVALFSIRAFAWVIRNEVMYLT